MFRAAAFLYNPATTRFTGAAQGAPPHNCAIGNPFTQESIKFTAFQTFLSQYEAGIYLSMGPDSFGSYYVAPIILSGHFDAAGTPIASGYQLRAYIDRFCLMIYGASISPEDTLINGSDTWLVLRDEAGADVSTSVALHMKYIALRTVS